jgi:hypothetical protein
MSSETADRSSGVGMVVCSGEDLSPIGVPQARSRRAGTGDSGWWHAFSVHHCAPAYCPAVDAVYAVRTVNRHTVNTGRRVAVCQLRATTRRCDRSPGHCRRTGCELAARLPRGTGAAAARRRQPHRI